MAVPIVLTRLLLKFLPLLKGVAMLDLERRSARCLTGEASKGVWLWLSFELRWRVNDKLSLLRPDVIHGEALRSVIIIAVEIDGL